MCRCRICAGIGIGTGRALAIGWEGCIGCGVGGGGAAEALGAALATGSSGGGGACHTGRVAHQIPAIRNNAMPKTGNHIGVCGSSSCSC